MTRQDANTQPATLLLASVLIVAGLIYGLSWLILIAVALLVGEDLWLLRRSR